MEQAALPFDDPATTSLSSESALAAACGALMGNAVRVSRAERALLGRAGRAPAARALRSLARAVADGSDPLGDAFTRLRSAGDRRQAGAVYTPAGIVEAMVSWIASQGQPARIVDPGAGSGRFVFALAERFPKASLVAVELDPLAALMLRANARLRKASSRLEVVVGDYRELELPPCTGPTAFVGNPPYVRHHDIDTHWKQWYRYEFARRGIRASALAGLHLHFFLQTLRLSRPGDFGAFVTAAEWLDVNYGSALRRLLTDQLGAIDLRILAPTIEAFPGTAATAAITGFRVGEDVAPVRVQQVSRLDAADAGASVERAELRAHARWSVLVRRHRPAAGGEIELGELFRVHRGQVTGANEVWVARDDAWQLPERLCLPAVTRARDLIDAGEQLSDRHALRRVVELPADLDQLSDDERPAVRRFLAWARARGAHEGYIARHRKAWWAVGLREPAPLLCTYMARRPPQFTLNACAARHINVAHGLYPRAPMAPDTLQSLARWLNRNVHVNDGRTYAGGLTKFEPKEVERLRLPRLESLTA